jgi:hypothetical protein
LWNDFRTKQLQAAEEAREKLIEQSVVAGEKEIEVASQVHQELVEKAQGDDATDYAGQRTRLERQMALYRETLEKKTQLTAEDYALLDQITQAGLAKISKTEEAAFQQDIARMRERIQAEIVTTSTEQQRLYAEYQKGLEQYSNIEEQKALKTAQTEAEIQTIHQLYAQMRAILTQKYADDLQKLLNSQGWQGVFGNYFGQMIKQNAQLYQQWSQSTNQSLMLVQLTMKSLQDQAQKMFQSMIQGMGQTMAQAIVTGKSVSQSMEQMLASVLESFAAQAFTAAIMASAWGFYDLAMGDYPAAASAFTSAAIFGTVGAAAAVAGKYASPASSSGSGAAGAGAAAGTSGSGAGGSGSPSSGQQQPTVFVTVQGHVIGPSGAAQLCDIINQAVYGNDATLYASHNRQGVPIG